MKDSIKKIYKEILNWVKEYYILHIGSLSLFLIIYFLRDLLDGLEWFKWGIYYLSFSLFYSTIHLPNNRLTRRLNTIVSFPIIVFKFLEPILLLLTCLMLHIGVYTMILVPLIFLDKIEILNLTKNGILYISLTVGSIIILLFGKYIVKFGVNAMEDEHRPYMKKLKSDFIQLLLNKDVFKLSLYSIYFIILNCSYVILLYTYIWLRTDFSSSSFSNTTLFFLNICLYCSIFSLSKSINVR